MAITVPAVALAVVVFAAAHEAERGLARLLGLLVVFVGGMELIVIVRSANYAFVVTRAGDLGLFLALFATFAGAGSLDYAALGRLEGAPLVVAAFGILLAAASKAGQVPFSPWLFRAMDGPTSVSALLHSAAMVAAGAYLVARLQPQLARVPGFGADQFRSGPHHAAGRVSRLRPFLVFGSDGQPEPLAAAPTRREPRRGSRLPETRSHPHGKGHCSGWRMTPAGRGRCSMIVPPSGGPLSGPNRLEPSCWPPVLPPVSRVGINSMRIAQIAPLSESVPPRGYGGTERIVSYLTEELVRQGHAVTLFASGDSVTGARLIPCSSASLRLDAGVRDHVPYHLCLLEEVRRRAAEFDVLHFHIDLFQFPLLREMGVPALTTLHGRLDLPDLLPFYRVFRDAPLVSISDAQRLPMPPVAWAATVQHGLPENLLPFSPRSHGYLAFLGRISPEKRPDRAIEIAARAGMPLKIAAKIDAVDRDYWNAKIAPLVRDREDVEFVGEIGDADKAAFLGGATALLFPIDWPEPFGLVMIEAMSCGTPVIAFPNGSVPEVVENGVTGFLAEDVEAAAQLVPQAAALDRRRIRARFDERFTARRMARDYVAIYAGLMSRLWPPDGRIRATGS